MHCFAYVTSLLNVVKYFLHSIRFGIFEICIPIKHKCITAQPLLEKIHIEPYLDDVELVVVGGESDKFARPFD